MRVIVCGGRNIGRTAGDVVAAEASAEVARASDERAFVMEQLSALHKQFGFTEIIAGQEGGAERIGVNWAGLNNVPVTIAARERRNFRKESVDERNIRMLASRPDGVICFGGGESTERLIAAAQKMGVPVTRIDVAAPRRSMAKPTASGFDDALARMAGK